MTDFGNYNFENNLNTAIISINIKEEHINSNCIYSNIHNGRQNLILQLLSTVANIKAMAFTSDPSILIIIFYQNRD